MVVADRIAALIRGSDVSAEYAGRGMCYLDFGNDEVAKVDVTFLKGERPVGGLEGPSHAFAADKRDFGASRIRRWFGESGSLVDHEWTRS